MYEQHPLEAKLSGYHNTKVDASVGLLKEPQKFRIQFLELHGDFSIVDNTELPRARV